MHRILVAIAAALLSLATPAAADTLHVIGAGSLTDAVSDLLRRFPAGPDTIAPAEFRPSGLMRTAIEAGQPPHLLTQEHLATLKPITQHVAFASDRGEQQNDWTGPLLWKVLADAGVIDAAKPDDAVRLIVRATGADGYTASVALAELAPAFAGHPIQLALAMNGAPLPDQSLRLIVPGDRRGGRSVRDVVRIELE